ncbi:Leucyl-tRNA synthetase [Methanonatronarchaeum thermophilum]|uniref:Leucine--tRNA ligase n=1 Tax=Methanonatronarchaeum thermophilum TaxID=1927129 RepID=A0A1Y3GAR7_9EURY|nr:leucine--tRNA ligase [Methanonatronarchaeum thermophilum]OUJ18357.1 Leucyl-tRNA synthetase [Methanonatronarchaeum thermophilum]
MVEEYIPAEIEEKWMQRWREEGVFEADPSSRDSYYVNVAYPYPSGSMHVGHGRTYTLPDIIARYKRMDGYNVLFPMAWHVTGTPVIGISRRIADGDEDTTKLYRDLYGVPEQTLQSFTDPEEIVNYFSQEYQKVMSRMGYSIDWRRQFRTVDSEYKSFIKWQFESLRELGLIKKGTHPVKYCPHDKNALGDHDLLEGEEAKIDEFTLIKFKLKTGEILPCATLRPETIFGVTNLWIKPDAEYLKIKVGKETWIVSEIAAEKLKAQNKDIKKLEKLKGTEIIGKKAKHPYPGIVEILPADFLDPNMASGVVMSVPAHAPYDLAALKQLKEKPTNIKPITVIETDRYKGEIPAEKILEEYNIESQTDPKLEKATEDLYGIEHAKGRISSQLGEYGGMGVKKGREAIKKDMIELGIATKMYEFNERPVICRCGEHAVVKIVEDQWFIDYSNQEWKTKTKQAIKNSNLIPKEIEKDFIHTINWLEEWAGTRRVGLGTKLPWDQEWIIEPLSDSTLYMAYYTIANHIKNREIDTSLFDYIFLGKGTPNEIAKKSELTTDEIEEMKKEFEYWYPYNYRFSAKDLIPNHLTFQIFHHTALLPQNLWPKGMSVCGMGLLEGKKMSSSKGNVVLLNEAIDKYGADTVRFFLSASAEPWQDFDWRENAVKSTHKNLKSFWRKTNQYLNYKINKPTEQKPIDQWLESRFNKTIKKTRESLEQHQTRKALQTAFYKFKKDIDWYNKRTNTNRTAAKKTLKNIATDWIKLLAPFIPYMTQELYSKTNKGEITQQKYPTPDKTKINNQLEQEEKLIKQTRKDIKEIIEVTGTKPNKINIYTASKWKWKVYNKAKKMKTQNQGQIMSELMQNQELRQKGNKVKKLLNKITTEIKKNNTDNTQINEKQVLQRAKNYLKQEFETKITIQKEENTENTEKAKNARPHRPAIYIE